MWERSCLALNLHINLNQPFNLQPVSHFCCSMDTNYSENRCELLLLLFFPLQSSKTQIWRLYSTNFPTFTGHSQSSKHILCVGWLFTCSGCDSGRWSYSSIFFLKPVAPSKLNKKKKERKEKPQKFFHTILKGNFNLSGCCVRPTNSKQQGCDSTLGKKSHPSVRPLLLPQSGFDIHD